MRSRVAGYIAVSVVTVGLVTAPARAEDRAYRWTDNDGVVQYTQQPPKDRPSELIRVQTGTSVRESAAPASAASTQQDAKQEGYCQAATKNLELLAGPGEVTQPGADGKPHVLTAAERKAELERTQKAVDLYCAPAPK